MPAKAFFVAASEAALGCKRRILIPPGPARRAAWLHAEAARTIGLAF
jgi:hypothetical protein